VFRKTHTFARQIYLTRIVLPLFVNLCLHLVLSVMTISGPKPVIAFVLGLLQGGICIYLLIQKVRQARATSLFYKSIYNYLDGAVIVLSLAMSGQILNRNTPPRAFVAYSIPILWIDLVLASRVSERSGVLMILLTEMTKGVLSFLVLLAVFVVGEFVPNYIPKLLHSNLCRFYICSVFPAARSRR
jgi:hypothetical protein